jgi:hypothetical protein
MSVVSYAKFVAKYAWSELPVRLALFIEDLEVVYRKSTQEYKDFVEKSKDPVNDLLAIALEDANAIRHALAIGEGKLEKLPKGITGNESQCVLARALSNGWYPFVESDDSTVFHVLDTKVTEQSLADATEALVHLGFKSNYFIETAHNSIIPSNMESELEIDTDDENSEVLIGRINIANTVAMAKLIDLFDQKLLPDLILERNYV